MAHSQDDEPTAAFVIPEGLLRRARGEEPPPDTERQPSARAQAPVEDAPTAPVARPPAPREPTRYPSRPLVEPPRLRRASQRPVEPLSAPHLGGPPTERAPEEDTLVNMNRDELLGRR